MKISIKNKRLPLIVGILAVVALMGIGIVAALGGTTTINGSGASSFPQGLNASFLQSTQWFNSFNTNTSDVMNFPYSAVSFTIFNQSNIIYAKDGKTGQIDYSGTDAATVINNAVSSLGASPSGGIIYLQPNIYWINSPITLTQKIELVGMGAEVTILDLNSTTINCVVINSSFVSIRNLGIWDNTTAVSGAGIRITGAVSDILIDNVKIAQQYVGIMITGNSTAYPFAIHLNNIYLSATISESLRIEEGADIYLSQVVATNVMGGQPTYGLHVTASAGNTTSGIWLSECDFISQGTGLQVDGAGIVQWLFVDSTAFDECNQNGINIGGTGAYNGITFTNSWASGNSLHGIQIGAGANGITIDTSKIIYNLDMGIHITSGTNILILGSEICANSQTGSGTYQGIDLPSGISNVTISNNLIGAGLGTVPNYQSYAVVFEGSSSNVAIANNNMNGNIYGSVYYIGALPTLASFTSNIGYVTSNSGSCANTTATTFVFAHGLAGAPMGVWASFNTTAVTGYSWTANATYVTVTVAGTLPASMTCYWTAQYNP